MNRKKGFTMVEVIIVIAVIAVLAAILIPVISTVIDNANEKSALSDAKNLLTGFISHVQEESVLKETDLVIAVHKGGKLFIFVYSGKDQTILVCKANPFKYNENASVRSNAAPVIDELKAKGALIDRANPVYDDAFIITYIRQSEYDPKEITIYANYYVNVREFAVVEKLDIATEVPDDPPEPVHVRITPFHDTENELYIYTITNQDVEKLGASLESTMEIDVTEILEALKISATDPGNTHNWNGFGIKIIDETGMNYSVLRAEFKSDKISEIMDGTRQLPHDMYPPITKSTAFKNYMQSIGYSTLSDENIDNYISKATAGTLSKTYSEYLIENYGDSIPVNKLAEVCKGDTVGSRKHIEPVAAKLLFNAMYENGYVYSFLKKYDASSFRQYRTAYENTVASMHNGWKDDGDINFYSVYDLLTQEAMTDLEVTEGTTTLTTALLLAWHENVVPRGNAFDHPDIHLYIEPKA